MNKYTAEQARSFFSFKSGSLVSQVGRWDVNYGSLYVSDDFDWFSSSTSRNSRSVIRDLGANVWTDAFEVPVVVPFPKLKEGESRNFSIDASGADGVDGAPGIRGADGVGIGRVSDSPGDQVAGATKTQPDERSIRGPRVSPVFVKAIVGHMYVIHVVDNDSDYYALFRVEMLERGDNCTITWKLIPSPEEPTGRR